jgi:hypothetical protein
VLAWTEREPEAAEDEDAWSGRRREAGGGERCVGGRTDDEAGI